MHVIQVNASGGAVAATYSKSPFSCTEVSLKNRPLCTTYAFLQSTCQKEKQEERKIHYLSILLPETKQYFIGIHSHKSCTNHAQESTVMKSLVKDLGSHCKDELITLRSSFASQSDEVGN